MKKWILLLTILCTSAQAEVFFGIHYGAALGTVKGIYPNAVYTKLKPAWLQKDQAFILIDGTGMSGQLRVAFSDSRPGWAAYSENDGRAILRALGADTSDTAVAAHMRWAQAQAVRTDDEALSVNWVRWTPYAPIPMARLVTRYGKPVCAPNETFDNICTWPSRALSATMDHDGKAALILESDFTEDERKKGLGLK